MKIKNFKISKKALALIVVGTIALTSLPLTGCTYEAAPKESYDIVQQGTDSSSGLTKAGLQQVLDVPGETFKLVTEYTCDDTAKREWRVTSDKFLYMKVYTQNLSKDTNVYIDNIHIDSSIKSTYASFDGILQDSMDDRIHNTAMIGFPISDSLNYYGVDAVEGSNQTFIQGTACGYAGYYNCTLSQKRYTENDYLDFGVYANKFQIVYDLLIQGPNDKTPRNVSVNTDFIVPVTSTRNAEVDKSEASEEASKSLTKK